MLRWVCIPESAGRFIIKIGALEKMATLPFVHVDPEVSKEEHEERWVIQFMFGLCEKSFQIDSEHVVKNVQ